MQQSMKRKEGRKEGRKECQFEDMNDLEWNGSCHLCGCHDYVDANHAHSSASTEVKERSVSVNDTSCDF